MTELQKAILALLNECVEKQDCDVDVMGHIERLKKIAYPCERDPLADLKAQYARDVETCKDIDGIEACWLWQKRLMPLCEWLRPSLKLAFDSPDCDYRRHPHADSIIEYHKCSARDKKRWQFTHDGIDGWLNCITPEWREPYEYRLKPETITINGKEYAAPLRVAPAVGTKYFVLSTNCCKLVTGFNVWDNRVADNSYLKNGHVFATEQDCQAVADAFNDCLRGDDND